MVIVNHPQQKNQYEVGAFVLAGTIFSAKSLWYLWVGKLHHFWVVDNW